ncbi:MAG: Flp family type IVb pilin [Chloroflexi bacterium]|nr:Flp family type IVb pilin [Chloroflexota bacterium]
MTAFFGRLIRALQREDGATLGEYSLVLAFILVACVAALTALGLVITDFYNNIIPGFG